MVCDGVVCDGMLCRPAELLSGMSLCLQSACQAEAQAITAHRAGQRCTSPATTAALHEGAAELFDEAARALKTNTGESASAAEVEVYDHQFDWVAAYALQGHADECSVVGYGGLCTCK